MKTIAAGIKKEYPARCCRPFNANPAVDEEIISWLK